MELGYSRWRDSTGLKLIPKNRHGNFETTAVNMRKLIFTLFLATATLDLLGQDLDRLDDGPNRRLGIGAILGEPTGLSVKYWLSNRNAVDGGVAWSFSERDSFHLHADYLFHNFDWLRPRTGQMPVYFGAGGRVLFEERRDNRAGIRAPIGISYIFDRYPLDAFVEVAPILDLTPGTKLEFNAGIGLRFYFR
jgi:hypothetical protein